MMVKFSTKDDIEQFILNEDRWSFHMNASNGNMNFHRVINSQDIESFRHTANQMCEHDWAIFVYRICFRELKINHRKTHELTAKIIGDDDNAKLQMDISIVSGPVGSQLRKKLGQFTLERDHEGEYDLFGWTRELKGQRDFLMDDNDNLRLDNHKIKEQMDDFLEKDSIAVDEQLAQQEHQLKVFTRLMNNMKNQYIKLQKGEVTDEEDLINLEKIRQINEEVKMEEPPKKKKVRVKKSMPKDATETKVKPKKIRKKKEKIETEPKVEKEVNLHGNISKATEAQSMASTHFKFRSMAKQVKDERESLIPPAEVKESGEDIGEESGEESREEVSASEETEEDTQGETQDDTDYENDSN
jgi:hypothetical protein